MYKAIFKCFYVICETQLTQSDLIMKCLYAIGDSEMHFGQVDALSRPENNVGGNSISTNIDVCI